jgi:flagellar biosynthesis/type III secretory pathway protein FliH
MSTSSISLCRGFVGLVSTTPQKAAVLLSDKGAAAREQSVIREEVRREIEAAYKARFDEQSRRMESLLKAFGEATEAFMSDFENKAVSQLVELAIRISEAIIRGQLPNREMTAEVIKKVLSPIMDLHGVRLKVSPADAAMLAKNIEKDLAAVLNQVELVEDRDLKVGDVVVESRNGYFNATLDQRIKLLEGEIMERCGHAISTNQQA